MALGCAEISTPLDADIGELWARVILDATVSEQEKIDERANCNVCDQLATELGEALIRQEKCADVRQGGPESPSQLAEDEQIELQLKTAKQHLIDHRRLIHPKP
jgi:hypothetical protein